MAPHFRNLVQIGEENKPAFSVLVSLQQKTLGDLHAVTMHSDHKVNEPVFDVDASLFVGQVALLPSPWIFVLLDWATTVGAKVGEAFSEVAKSLESEKPKEEVKEEKVKEEEEEIKLNEEEEIKLKEAEKEEKKEEASLIPNVVVRLHMDRMAMYVVENCCDAASPVFLVCFGVDLNTHVSPFLDIAVGLQVNNTRAARSNPELQLLPTDMRDALYPFALGIDVTLTEQLKKIRARVHGQEIVMRLGILDAKLVLNAITNLLPPNKDDVKEKVAGQVAETVQQKMNEDTSEVPPEPKKEEKKEEEKKEPKEEIVESSEPAMHIEANVVLEKIAFILVNDAKPFELPVLQFNIKQVKVDAAMGANLFCHVLLAFSSDYYKSSQALWEPFMEAWSMSIHVKQIKDRDEKDPYQPEAAVDEKESDAMQVFIDAPRVLQMNLTATLMSTLVETLSDFLNCLGGKREQTDGFFVMVQNSTGFDMTYRIEKDGGINEMMMLLESHATEELQKDHVLYAAVCDVGGLVPHARALAGVPLVRAAHAPVLAHPAGGGGGRRDPEQQRDGAE